MNNLNMPPIMPFCDLNNELTGGISTEQVSPTGGYKSVISLNPKAHKREYASTDYFMDNVHCEKLKKKNRQDVLTVSKKTSDRREVTGLGDNPVNHFCCITN